MVIVLSFVLVILILSRSQVNKKVQLPENINVFSSVIWGVSDMFTPLSTNSEPLYRKPILQQAFNNDVSILRGFQIIEFPRCTIIFQDLEDSKT